MTHMNEWERTLREGFRFPVIEPYALFQDVALVALRAIEGHINESSAVRTYIEALPKGRGTCCPSSNTEAVIGYLANQTGTVDKSDPELNLRFMRDIVIPRLVFEREVMGHVAQSQSVAITMEELRILDGSRRLASAVDDLWAKLFAAVVVPFQSLD